MFEDMVIFDSDNDYDHYVVFDSRFEFEFSVSLQKPAHVFTKIVEGYVHEEETEFTTLGRRKPFPLRKGMKTPISH